MREKYKRRFQRLKRVLLAKETKRIILLWITPEEDKRWPEVDQSDLEELKKRTDHCERLEEIRGLVVAAREEVIWTAATGDLSGDAGEANSSHLHASGHVSVFTIECDSDVWADRAQRDACNDPPRMCFGSVGRIAGVG